MKLCRTEAGDIPVSGPVEMYANGMMRSCSPCGECILKTEAGELVPQYSGNDLRRKNVQALHFYESGALKSLPLQKMTPVFTPVGIIPAEMVTFYKSGRVKRVFPLNGKLSGYWAQEDEESLAETLTLNTPVGVIRSKIISICFYENGALKSITFWPGEEHLIETPVGKLKVRIGIAFNEGGDLLSVEPAEPTPVETPAGVITAYDPDAVGINGDINSLVFGTDGKISRVVTTLTSINATLHSGSKLVYTPRFRESLCGDGDREVVPMTVDFNKETVSVRKDVESDPEVLSFKNYDFVTEPFLPQLGFKIGMGSCSI